LGESVHFDFLTTVLPIGAIAVVTIAAALFVRSRLVPNIEIGLRDIPKVLAQLSQSTSTPAFAAFALQAPSAEAEQKDLNLQFSIEDGRIGFDWVLIAPLNIEDQARFVDFARSEGFAPEPKEMNRVRYLRAEDGDLARLCCDIITKMYGLPETIKLELIAEGFMWQPGD
jgi:hypothetical protein